MDAVVTVDKTTLDASGQVVQAVQVSDPNEMTTATENGASSTESVSQGQTIASDQSGEGTETEGDTDALYTQIDGTMIYVESGTAAEYITEATEGWKNLPEGIRNKLAEYGMRIYLSETACSNIGVQYGGYAYGLKYKANAATLEITSITQNAYCIIGTKGDVEGTVLHEIGHLLDFGIAIMEEGVYSTSNCRISDSEEWQQICASDGADIAAIDSQTAVNSYSNKELFAEAFRLVCQGSEDLKVVSPDAYNFVQRMVEKYTSSAG